nr:hypothetical protein [uncultured Flavobacterium sp.]
MENKPLFRALLTFFSEKETGNYAPFSTGVRIEIKFPFQNKTCYANLNFTENELIFPGDVSNVDVILFSEENIDRIIYIGLDFIFYSNNKMIGTGVVSNIK